MLTKFQLFVYAAFVSAGLLLSGCRKNTTTIPQPVITLTPLALPSVATSPVLGVNGNTAICGGTVSSEGTSAVTAVGICWDVNSGPTTLRNHTNEGAGTGSYQSILTNLVANTTYYVRAYASNLNGTAYGAEVSFKTPAGWSSTLPAATSYNFNYLAVMGSAIFASGNYSGSYGVFKSTDDGATWSGPLNGTYGQYVNALLVKGTSIFAGSSSGVYVSNDNGSTWTAANNGLFGSSVTLLCSNGSYIFAGTNYEVYSSSNNGTNWNVVPSLSMTVNGLASVGTNVFAGSYGYGILKSTDNGNTWSAANTGFAGASPGYMAAAGNSVYANSNSYPYISYVTSNLGNSWSTFASGSITNLTALANSGNSVLAGTSNGVYQSDDNGSTWKGVNTGLTNLNIRSIVVSGSNAFATDSYGSFYKKPL